MNPDLKQVEPSRDIFFCFASNHPKWQAKSNRFGDFNDIERLFKTMESIGRNYYLTRLSSTLWISIRKFLSYSKARKQHLSQQIFFFIVSSFDWSFEQKIDLCFHVSESKNSPYFIVSHLNPWKYKVIKGYFYHFKYLNNSYLYLTGSFVSFLYYNIFVIISLILESTFWFYLTPELMNIYHCNAWYCPVFFLSVGEQWQCLANPNANIVVLRHDFIAFANICLVRIIDSMLFSHWLVLACKFHLSWKMFSFSLWVSLSI